MNLQMHPKVSKFYTLFTNVLGQAITLTEYFDKKRVDRSSTVRLKCGRLLGSKGNILYKEK